MEIELVKVDVGQGNGDQVLLSDMLLLLLLFFFLYEASHECKGLGHALLGSFIIGKLIINELNITITVLNCEPIKTKHKKAKVEPRLSLSGPLLPEVIPISEA